MKGMLLLELPQELITEKLWLPECLVAPVLGEKVFGHALLGWARASNGGGQKSALEEHNLPQNATQRYTAPRGLATRLTPCRKGRSRHKGCFSLPDVSIEKMIKRFFMSAPARARSQDQIVSSMGGELDTNSILPM